MSFSLDPDILRGYCTYDSACREEWLSRQEGTHFQEPQQIIDFISTSQFELTDFCARANMVIHGARVLEFQRFDVVSLDVDTQICITVNTEETVILTQD